MKLIYDIYDPGEFAAGIHPFSDTITVNIESSNPPGEEGEFAEELRKFIAEWYDTTGVTLKKDS